MACQTRIYGFTSACSHGPFLEMFARGGRDGWISWGNQADDYDISWATYSNHSQAGLDQLVLAP